MWKFASAALAAFALILPLVPAWADINIAVVGPMSGQYQQFGEQMRRGAVQAVEDINIGGGLLGSTVALAVEDDRCDPRQAVAIANFLPGDEIFFVAGHFCSAASIPASKIYEEESIIQITPASTDPKLTDEGGRYIFRVAGREDRQAELAAHLLAARFTSSRIAILHNGSAYGQGLAELMKARLNASGVTETLFTEYEPGQNDYSDLVAELSAAGIEVMYLGGHYLEAATLLVQSHERGYTPQLIGGDMLAASEFWQVAGAAAEGTLATFVLDPRSIPNAAPVVARFRAQQYEPEGFTLYTYAAVQVWSQAVLAAGTLEPAKVTEMLHTRRFKTVLGDIVFDANGDMNIPGYVWYQWSGGQFLRR